MGTPRVIGGVPPGVVSLKGGLRQFEPPGLLRGFSEVLNCKGNNLRFCGKNCPKMAIFIDKSNDLEAEKQKS